MHLTPILLPLDHLLPKKWNSFLHGNQKNVWLACRVFLRSAFKVKKFILLIGDFNRIGIIWYSFGTRLIQSTSLNVCSLKMRHLNSEVKEIHFLFKMDFLFHFFLSQNLNLSRDFKIWDLVVLQNLRGWKQKGSCLVYHCLLLRLEETKTSIIRL